MQIIEVWGKQKVDTAFSARKIPTGSCGVLSVGKKTRFFRAEQQ